jgi:nitrogen fixation NifU-like protein
MEAEDFLKKLRSFYSETTIQHILQPHNTESIPNADGFADYNSGCGETMKIWLKTQNNSIRDAAFCINGCAAAIACGIICTDLATGISVTEALHYRCIQNPY